MSLSLSSVRRRLYHNLFDLTTRSGRRFEGLCALFALLSVLVIFVESGVGTEYHLTFDEWHIFVAGALRYLILPVNTCSDCLAGPNRQIRFSFWVY